MIISVFRDNAATRSASQESDLHKIRLINILNGLYLFRNGGGNRGQPYRTASEFFNDGPQHMSVGRLKSQRVNVNQFQSLFGHGAVYELMVFDLGKISYSLQKPIGHTGRSTRTDRYFFQACFMSLHT